MALLNGYYTADKPPLATANERRWYALGLWRPKLPTLRPCLPVGRQAMITKQQKGFLPFLSLIGILQSQELSKPLWSSISQNYVCEFQGTTLSAAPAPNTTVLDVLKHTGQNWPMGNVDKAGILKRTPLALWTPCIEVLV